MQTLKLLRILILLLAVSITTTTAFAAKEHIEAVGAYTLGDRDTRDVAERRAVQDAIRVATQKAGVYVEGYSKVHNLVLTKDEINTIAMAILRVYDQDIEFVNNGTVCRATVYAVAETDNIENILANNQREGGTKQRQQPKSLADMNSEFYGKTVSGNSVDVSTYTGVVIDCLNTRNRQILVVNRPGIEATEIKAQDGRIIFGYRVPTQKFSFEYAYYLSSYNPKSVEKLAGTNPLWIHPLYVENPKKKSSNSSIMIYSGSIVISNEDGDILEDFHEQTGLLGGARPPVVILGGRGEMK